MYAAAIFAWSVLSVPSRRNRPIGIGANDIREMGAPDGAAAGEVVSAGSSGKAAINSEMETDIVCLSLRGLFLLTAQPGDKHRQRLVEQGKRVFLLR
jgi:hypothetical protein